MTESKICITCKKELPISDFHNNKRRLSGKNNECKFCCSEKVKECVSKKVHVYDGKIAVKVCVYCKHTKEVKCFVKRNDSKDGYKNACKKCIGERNKEWRKNVNYYEINKDKLKENRNRWLEKYPDGAKISARKNYANNKEKRSLEYKIYYNNNKEKRIEYAKNHRKKNIERYREAQRNWFRNNSSEPFRKIRKNVSGRILKVLKRRKGSLKTTELIGCSIEEFVLYIENQFTEGMTWGNMGRNGWHIDHKIPLSWFNLEEEEQLRKAFHYTNTQPLWESDNCKKGNRYADV